MSVTTVAGATPTATENGRVQIARVTDTEYTELPGVSSVSLNGGESPTRDIPTYQKTSQLVSNPGPGTVEIQCNALVVAHPSYPILMKAWKEVELIRFRWQYEDRLFRNRSSTHLVSIAQDGTVTFNAGVTHPKWGTGRFVYGSVIRTGNSPDYVYHNVVDYANGVPEVEAIAADLNDEEYDVVAPPVNQPEFLGYVTRFGAVQAPAQGELSCTLMIAPEDVLPDYEIGRII